MKLLSLTATISVALFSFIPNVCLSQTLVKGVKYPEISSAQLPSCYIETSDNRILDLTRMCAPPDEAGNQTSHEAQQDPRWSMQGRAAMQSYRGSRDCVNSDGSAPNEESGCGKWAASSLPGVPY